MAPGESLRLKTLRVLPRAGNRARGWLIAGPLRVACALGPKGIVRDKREGDGATPAGRFRLLWGYYRPDRRRPPAGGVPQQPLRRDDDLYDLVFVLDHNFSRRAKGRGSAIFFHLARPDLTSTAGCVAISAADMRKLAPRLARRAEMWIG